MKKTIYILALLSFLAATMAMFSFVGCEQASQSSPRPILYVFTTDGCGACIKEKPLIDAIKATGRLIVVYGNAEMAEQRQIYSYPTYVLNDCGRDVWRGTSIVPLYDQIMGAR